ncbi:hypothetical protein A3G56_02955 [Candidatus Falkowbacteria bacterium RIFCSPLOWO2_12_FULL_45_10]|uniref:Uncharacterized protein n=1 Tax=Candidatus Falkowbacteria bacterium RIFCSPLOWO2_12_FULL_45_10 TaxID=1797990 RepID=A0A1F5RZC2_9BACT|nr:MAG: hypothetical protein A3G56_02955 [Candidatus Falkowbacteria bacterium RIFCSPLOWO2_12_FULL_45_10]
MAQPAAVQTIAEKIMAAVGSEHLPAEAKELIQENLEAQILRRLGLIIIEHLDEEGLKAYEQLTADGALPTAGEMQSFLEAYLPDYEEKVKAGMEEFMKEVAEIIQKSHAKS